MRRKEITWSNHMSALRFGFALNAFLRGAVCEEAALNETVTFGGFVESTNLLSAESIAVRLRFCETPAGLGIAAPRVVKRTF
jgi:hypothetical protein